jgi:ABC-type antimicrobial peptide transport system permease subunit
LAGIDILPVQRPAEIVNSNSIGSAPVVLALALLLGAMLSLGLALAASVRRRRGDLAVLRTLGFTRRQLGATVRWQATTTVGVGLLVGVPVGALIGRALWDQFARQLNVVAQPRLPLTALFGIALGAVVVGNAVAVVPARVARRVATSRGLHAE